LQAKNSTYPGRLLFIVGASGAGKDSLINTAVAHALLQDKLLLAPRVVTRSNQQSGSDQALTEQEYLKQRNAGIYLFSWQAHGYYYGIENDILLQLKEGNNILVNGSRAYIDSARENHPDVIIVGVEAKQQHLQKRLQKRGRESTENINERLARNSEYQSALQQADFVINNQQPVEQAAMDLLLQIRELASTVD
jgi:ribose 1,5-bisphosphokinase